MQLYDYIYAIPPLKEHLDKNPNDMVARVYISKAFYEIEKYNQVLHYLNGLDIDANVRLKKILAVCLLQNKQLHKSAFIF